MTKIRLTVLNEIHDENSTDVNYKTFITSFVNNTLLEIKNQLNTFHFSKEIECRKKLSNFFKQKLADFELLLLLDEGIKYLQFDELKENFNIFEDLANRLAHVFENLKNTIAPSWNVEESLKTLYLEDLNINRENIIDTKYLERFVKIYLERENLEYFNSVEVHENIVTLNNKYKLALCGDLYNPKFILMDINLPIKNFTIENFVKFLKLKDKYFELYNLFCKFKNLRNFVDLHIEGRYLNFKVIIDGLHFEANENFNNCQLINFCDKLSAKYQNLYFTIENGWISFYKQGIFTDIEITPKKDIFFTKNDNDIAKFFKSHFYSEKMIRFFDPKIFKKFRDFLERENIFFKPIEKIFENEKFIKNFFEIKFKNIAIKFISFTNKFIEFDLYFEEKFIFITENGYIKFEKKSSRLLIEEFYLFLKNPGLDFIPDFYKFYIKDPKSLQSIKTFDKFLEIEILNFKLKIFEKYCQIENVKVRNVKKYLKFIFDIFINSDNILEDFLEVEIQGFVFKYSIVTDKIMTPLKNGEIIGQDNISFILLNLKVFYRYALIPDYVTNNCAIFFFDKKMKIKFTNDFFSDPRVWFRKLHKTVCGKSFDVELEEFIRIYRSNKSL